MWWFCGVWLSWLGRPQSSFQCQERAESIACTTAWHMVSLCRQDVRTECVVLPGTAWLTVLLQSMHYPWSGRIWAPCEKWREEAGSWHWRTSCSPVLDTILPQAPQTWGGYGAVSIRGSSRLPYGSSSSPWPPGRLSRSGPLSNSRGGQGDRWQLLPAEPLTRPACCSAGAWEKGQGPPHFSCWAVNGSGLSLRIS